MTRRRGGNAQFNLLVTGHSKAGKTDFIQTLFETVAVCRFIPETETDSQTNLTHLTRHHHQHLLFPEPVGTPSPSTCSIECIPIAGESLKVTMRLIDSPGLSIPIGMNRASAESVDALQRHARDYVRGISAYIERQYAFTLEKETKLRRDPKVNRDTQVHACLYLLAPEIVLSNHGLSAMDIVALKGLCERVNVIPCLSKSDQVSARELKQLRGYLHEDFIKQGLKIYKFAEDADDYLSEDSLLNKLPFCLVNSEELAPTSGVKLREMGLVINNHKVLGREFIWGTMQVENPSHCDFSLLKSILFDSHMDDLKEMTRGFYETWRSCYMLKNSRSILLPADLAVLEDEVTRITV